MITGEMLIGNQTVRGSHDAIKGINPTTGQAIKPGVPRWRRRRDGVMG